MTRARPGVAVVTGSSAGSGGPWPRRSPGKGMTPASSTGRDPAAAGLRARSRRAQRASVGRRGRPARPTEGIRGLVDGSDRRTSGASTCWCTPRARSACGNLEAAGLGATSTTQYRVNLRAPFLLTKALPAPAQGVARPGRLRQLDRRRSRPAPDNGALRGHEARAAVARRQHPRRTSIRTVIRVLSVFPGRTATPMQEAVLQLREAAATSRRSCSSRATSPR